MGGQGTRGGDNEIRLAEHWSLLKLGDGFVGSHCTVHSSVVYGGILHDKRHKEAQLWDGEAWGRSR